MCVTKQIHVVGIQKRQPFYFYKKKKNGERKILLRRRYKEGVGKGKYFGFPFCKAGWCESYDML